MSDATIEVVSVAVEPNDYRATALKLIFHRVDEPMPVDETFAAQERYYLVNKAEVGAAWPITQ